MPSLKRSMRSFSNGSEFLTSCKWVPRTPVLSSWCGKFPCTSLVLGCCLGIRRLCFELLILPNIFLHLDLCLKSVDRIHLTLISYTFQSSASSQSYYYYYYWGIVALQYCVSFCCQSVHSLSRVRLFVTPWTAAFQASLSITNSRSLLKLMSTESVCKLL